MLDESCPLCGSEIRRVSQPALYLDLVARILGFMRTLHELRANGVVAIGELVRTLASGEGLPEASDSDRRCPYCRKGYVTRSSERSLVLDASCRALGAARSYCEVRTRPGFSMGDLLRVIVDGEEAVSTPTIYATARDARDVARAGGHAEVDCHGDASGAWVDDWDEEEPGAYETA